MPSLACPQCATKLSAPAEVLGQAVRCTGCGGTFIASTVLSPYQEGLPPLPKDRRRLWLVIGVLSSLAITFALLVGIQALMAPDDDQAPVIAEFPPPSRSDARGPLTTRDGIPIEVVDDLGPDQLPPPGQDVSPALKKIMERTAKAPEKKEPKIVLDDVTLLQARWISNLGQRTLNIAYSFNNGNSPSTSIYVLRIKLNNEEPLSSTMNSLLPATGVMSIALPGIIDDKLLPKAEVWVEQHLAAGVVKKVSNVIPSE